MIHNEVAFIIMVLLLTGFKLLLDFVHLYEFVSKVSCNNFTLFAVKSLNTLEDINFTWNYVLSSFSIDNQMFKKYVVTLQA